MSEAMNIDFRKVSLGIEFGSTRVKGVLLDERHRVLACANQEWSDHVANGWWSYELSEAISLLQKVYASLKKQIEDQSQEKLTVLGSIGVSGMMHGFLPFDQKGNQLCEFRTWRNTKTEKASAFLSNLFAFNIPQRWSVAHLYQAVLDDEPFVKDISFMTTLAGYIHTRLTGEKIVGVGEASGMFPLDEEGQYDKKLISRFDGLLKAHGIAWKLCQVLPKPILAGQDGGHLSEEGALLLDPTGDLKAGILFCPPEGDAGTGMVATDSVLPGTGNLSAGTSIFLMACLPHPLRQAHPEIDVVTTPEGKPVAMVHCNTGTSDFDAWIALFGEFARKSGIDLPKNDLYDLAYQEALSAPSDAGGLLAYNCYSGEPVCGIREGRPLFVRKPDSPLSLADFFRAHLNASLAGLCLGERILSQEGITLEKIVGQGGMFKNPKASHLFADALAVPIQILKNASEGGPYGMALLAQYLLEGKGETLGDYLARNFDFGGQLTKPDPEQVKGYRRYLAAYEKGIAIEKEAAKALR
jgi:sugar (pentulose or hexulose) kinase